MTEQNIISFQTVRPASDYNICVILVIGLTTVSGFHEQLHKTLMDLSNCIHFKFSFTQF